MPQSSLPVFPNHGEHDVQEPGVDGPSVDEFDADTLNVGTANPKSSSSKMTTIELSGVESLLFFNMVRFNPRHDSINWEHVAYHSNLKNAASAKVSITHSISPCPLWLGTDCEKVRFRQILKKHGLEHMGPVTPRSQSTKRKAADFEEDGDAEAATPTPAPRLPVTLRKNAAGGRAGRGKKPKNATMEQAGYVATNQVGGQPNISALAQPQVPQFKNEAASQPALADIPELPSAVPQPQEQEQQERPPVQGSMAGFNLMGGYYQPDVYQRMFYSIFGADHAMPMWPTANPFQNSVLQQNLMTPFRDQFDNLGSLQPMDTPGGSGIDAGTGVDASTGQPAPMSQPFTTSPDVASTFHLAPLNDNNDNNVADSQDDVANGKSSKMSQSNTTDALDADSLTSSIFDNNVSSNSNDYQNDGGDMDEWVGLI